MPASGGHALLIVCTFILQTRQIYCVLVYIHPIYVYTVRYVCSCGCNIHEAKRQQRARVANCLERTAPLALNASTCKGSLANTLLLMVTSFGSCMRVRLSSDCPPAGRHRSYRQQTQNLLKVPIIKAVMQLMQSKQNSSNTPKVPTSIQSQSKLETHIS